MGPCLEVGVVPLQCGGAIGPLKNAQVTPLGVLSGRAAALRGGRGCAPPRVGSSPGEVVVCRLAREASGQRRRQDLR